MLLIHRLSIKHFHCEVCSELQMSSQLHISIATWCWLSSSSISAITFSALQTSSLNLTSAQLFCILLHYMLYCIIWLLVSVQKWQSQVLISILQLDSKYMAELGIETHFKWLWDVQTFQPNPMWPLGSTLIALACLLVQKIPCYSL